MDQSWQWIWGVEGWGWASPRARARPARLPSAPPAPPPRPHHVRLPPRHEQELERGPAKPVKPGRVVGPAIDSPRAELAVGRLDEEAAQAFHDRGRHPHVGAAVIEFAVQGQRLQQGRVREKVVAREDDLHEVARVLGGGERGGGRVGMRFFGGGWAGPHPPLSPSALPAPRARARSPRPPAPPLWRSAPSPPPRGRRGGPARPAGTPTPARGSPTRPCCRSGRRTGRRRRRAASSRRCGGGAGRGVGSRGGRYPRPRPRPRPRRPHLVGTSTSSVKCDPPSLGASISTLWRDRGWVHLLKPAVANTRAAPASAAATTTPSSAQPA